MLKIVVLTGIAGVVGVFCRYFCTASLGKFCPDFPWGTFTVNVIGSFLAGFLFVLCNAQFSEYRAYFPILFVGFLGAFTTFSTFALESSKFLMAAQYGKFALDFTLHNVLGLGAAFSGLYVARLIWPVPLQ